MDLNRELLPRVRQELERAVIERQHGWRTPALASLSEDGWPSTRTVVLRALKESDSAFGLCFEIHTDHRSPKVAQLKRDDRAQLLFWCPRLSWQLRVWCRATVIAEGPEIDQLWQQIKDGWQARDYLTERSPGAPLSDRVTQDKDHAFSIVRLSAQQMDWLEINRSGHRRARIEGTSVIEITP